MPNTAKQDIPASGTDPAPQNEARLAPGRDGDDAMAAAEQSEQRGRRIDCSPGEERGRPTTDGHGRHR